MDFTAWKTLLLMLGGHLTCWLYFQFGKDAALYVQSFVLYTPFLKGRTTSTNSRFKYVPLAFLKISAVADKAFKIVHK